jgi:hypothetical protein
VKGLVLLVAGAAIALVGMAVFFAPSLYEVVDSGRHLRPYESGVIYEIRVAESATIYAASESKPDVDAISGSVLVALATASLLVSLLLGSVGESRHLRTFYGIAAGGFAFLAADEFFAIHETIGHNLLFLSDVPGVERPDDLIIASYLVPAAIFLFYFRDVLTSSPRAIAFFAGGMGLFALAAICDLAGVGADEPLEVLSAACLAAGFGSLIAGHLTEAVRPRDLPTA